MKKISYYSVLAFLGLGSVHAVEDYNYETALSVEPGFCMGEQLVKNNQDIFSAATQGSIDKLNAIFETRCYDLYKTYSHGLNILDIAVWYHREALRSLILFKIKTKKWNRDLLEHCVESELGSSCFAPSALHIAVLRDDFSAIKSLIAVGARIEATDAFGQTPLQYAIKAENALAMKILINANASIDRLSLNEMNTLVRILNK